MNENNESSINKINQDTPNLTAEQYKALSKWLSLLFWLCIPSVVGYILSNVYVDLLNSFVYLLGNAAIIAVSLLYGFFMFKLSEVRKDYKKSAILDIASLLIYNSIFILSEDFTSVIIFLTISAVLGAAAYYYEIKAHSSALIGIDDTLSTKWKKFWKWYIIFTVATIAVVIIAVVVLVIVFSSVVYNGGSTGGILFGLIVLLLLAIALLIASVVISVLRLLYLYRTARIFKNLYEGHNM